MSVGPRIHKAPHQPLVALTGATGFIGRHLLQELPTLLAANIISFSDIQLQTWRRGNYAFSGSMERNPAQASLEEVPALSPGTIQYFLSGRSVGCRNGPGGEAYKHYSIDPLKVLLTIIKIL